MRPNSVQFFSVPLAFISVGETVKFDCRVCGAPAPEVTWWKDGKELEATEKYDFKAEGQIFTLIIRDAMPEDRGLYTCQAHNKNGTVRYHPELLVRGGRKVLSWFLKSYSDPFTLSFPNGANRPAQLGVLSKAFAFGHGC